MDEQDIYKNTTATQFGRDALAAFWVLQHQKGFKPFINVIRYKELKDYIFKNYTICGYNDLDVKIKNDKVMDFTPLVYYYGAWFFCIIGIIIILFSLLLIKDKIGKALLGIGIVCLIPISYFKIQFIQYDIRSWKALSPMQKAIDKNKYNKVKQFIEEGYDINEENVSSHPSTPLSYAINKGNIRIVQLLVENGADVNYITSTNPSLNIPLTTAIYRGDTAIVNYLLAQGANVSVRENFYPIEYAIRSYKPNNKEMVEALIKYGADVNANNGAALRGAIDNYYYEIVRCLLEHGANVGNNMQKLKDRAKRIGTELDIDSVQITKMVELLEEYTPK